MRDFYWCLRVQLFILSFMEVGKTVLKINFLSYLWVCRYGINHHSIQQYLSRSPRLYFTPSTSAPSQLILGCWLMCSHISLNVKSDLVWFTNRKVRCVVLITPKWLNKTQGDCVESPKKLHTLFSVKFTETSLSILKHRLYRSLWKLRKNINK